MVVRLRISVEQPAHERHERDALQVGVVLAGRGVLLIAQQFLETVRVAQRLGGERRDDLAEPHVGIRERLGVAVGAQEDGADHVALPLNRHDDDRAHVARVELRFDAAQRRIVRGVGNEHRLAGVEGALQLGIAFQVHHQVADGGILVARDEADFVVLAGQEDRAAIEAEGVTELSRDGLQNVDEVEGSGDLLQDVDYGDQVVALALQLRDARAEPPDLVIP